eukprot:4183170-Prymnesium_polylepis.1
MVARLRRAREQAVLAVLHLVEHRVHAALAERREQRRRLRAAELVAVAQPRQPHLDERVAAGRLEAEAQLPHPRVVLEGVGVGVADRLRH